jgi:hypothetical protein
MLASRELFAIKSDAIMKPFKLLLLVLAVIALAAPASLHAGAPLYPYNPVGTGLELELDASYINTSDTNEVIAQNGTMLVQSWWDYSGNGNNATQSLTYKMPSYIPNALPNGQPVVMFDGTSDFLTTALAQIPGNKSIYIVENRTNPRFGTELASTTGSGGNYLGNSYGGGYETEGNYDVAQDLAVPGSASHFILKSYIVNSGTSTLTVDGTSTSATGIDSAAGNYAISDPNYFHFGGQIAEILIYNRVLLPAEQTSIISYLTDKWGLQDTPPPVVAGLQLRLAANTIDTTNASQVSQAGGSFYVANWLDSSGNGLQASQSATWRQPLYVPNAVNGEPALLFSGTGEYLTTTLPQITGNKSIFVVEQRVDNQLRCEISSSAVTSGLYLGSAYGASVETAGRLYVSQDIATPGYVGGYILKSFIRSGGTCTLGVNGYSTSAQVPDEAAGTYTISDPGSFHFAGQIAEVLVYNRAVSSTEQQLIEDYLSQKYGLWEAWLQDRTGLNLWLDAGAVSTGTNTQYPQVSGTALAVNTWLDRSTYGSNATQSGAANQPLYWVSGNGTMRPTLRFDGAAAKYMTTALPQISGDKSIFVYERRRVDSALGREISSTGSVGHALENAGSSEAVGPVGGTPSLQVPGDFYEYMIKDFIRSGQTESIYVDDNPATGTVADTVGGNYTISDPNAPFIGDIGTVLAYSRAVVSATERYAIEDYLQDRWSYAPNNIYSVAPDLILPSDTSTTTPAAGVMVQQTAPAFAGQAVYNTLYLPTNWQKGQLYPVIVEFPPNGGYTDSGYTTTGYPEDCSLGYGISGGQGYIVIGMPCIGGSPLSIQTQWWGSEAETEAYCLNELQNVLQNYGGDPSAVFLAGFSRGAAACNFIGLYDSNIADAWLAFIPHSGYDYDYEYPAPYDPPTIPFASTRLARLAGRAQYISQGSQIQGGWEISYKYYLETLLGTNLSNFTFRTLPYENHTGSWALRPIQLRRDIRAWMQQVLATRPGTSSISGTVKNHAGNPVAGALVQSGPTHFTYTVANGTYLLQSIINSTRTVTVTSGSYNFTPQTVTVSGANLTNVNFQSSN